MSDELKNELECTDPDCGGRHGHGEHHHHEHDGHHHHHHDGEHHHHHAYGEECDDPGCGCHEHRHGHGEHHHRHHEHDGHHHHEDGAECDDPDCECHHHHHSEAEQIAESAMVIGEKRAYHPAEPIARADMEERMKSLFLRLGSEIAEGGFVLGHLKGSVSAPDGSFFAVSCTRAGTVDITASAEWETGAPLADYEFTLNVLSVVHKDVDIDAAFAELE